MPWRRATFCMVSMTSWLWSAAMLVVAKTGRHLELGRGHLVVLGFGGDAHLPQLDVKILHEGGNAILDRAEILVFQLLALGGGCAEKRSAAGQEIKALQIVLLFHQEIFLLGANRGGDSAWRWCCPGPSAHAGPGWKQRPWTAAAGFFYPGPRPCRNRRRWGCTG